MQFRVSWGFSKKIRAQQRRTGRKERPKQSQHGPVSRLTQVEQPLRAALGQQPDLTLAELQQRIAEATGIAVSRSRLWVWLRTLGLRHKKNRSARTNKRAARISGAGRRGGN